MQADAAADTSGAPVDAHAVALQTIEAQQHVIARLQELVQTLKQRVDESPEAVERLPRGVSHEQQLRSADAEQQLQQQHLALQEQVQKLTAEKARLQRALLRAADMIKEQQSRLVEQAAQLHAHDIAARQWREQVAMHEYVKVQYAQQQAALTEVHGRLAGVTRSRAQWRTLARLLATRVGASLQDDVQAHMRELDSRDGDEAAVTATYAAPHTTSTASSSSGSSNCTSRTQDDGTTMCTPAVEDVMAVWKASEHSSERGTAASLSPPPRQQQQQQRSMVRQGAHTGALSSHTTARLQPRSRHALPRFLVPL